MFLAVAWVAACADQSVVDPPAPTVASDAAPGAMAMAQASDRDILTVLYEATDGRNWRDNTNWLTDKPLGEWYGVNTDASGRVTELQLSGWWEFEENHYVDWGLSGPVPAELGGLTRLEHLDLAINKLSGPIPVELGSLANLEYLHLGRNELTGPIPVELAGLANLGSLLLGGNELSGTIPVELGGLANLANLDLGDNDLTGTIPSELGGLNNLRRLNLDRNGLSGTIPVELGGLARLGTLWLAANDLTGPVPAELGNLTSMWQMSLAGNALAGAVPPELGSLANLNTLYLHSNELSGTIPRSFQQLSELDYFGFQNNSGLCLPDVLVAWYEAMSERNGPVCPDRQVLRVLYETAGGDGWTNATGWLGGGPLGQWHGVDVDSSGLVSTVDLAGNGLSGGLPERLGTLAGLTTLRIGDNALTGRLPTSLRLTPLQELGYANTDLCAPAERWFQEWLATLSQHEGTGVQCPPLSDREILAALYETTDGANWEEARNWLTDAPLGQWHGVETSAEGRVVSLDLRSNELEGQIPRELGGLAELETLILFDNRLAGPIPPELGSLAKAKLVVLAANELSGPIPPELGALASVEELFLNGNRLTSVPAELGELSSLEALGLNFNQLTSVPPELGGLAQLEYLGLWSNELTFVPPELGQLGNLVELDLDENRLASVPPELGRLDSLQFLWLASNELSSIPVELSALNSLRRLVLEGNRLAAVPFRSGGYASLEVLDLSSNEFASFPWALGELDNLFVLGLDGNRLEDIPLGSGGFASLEILDLSSNELTSFPWELGELDNLSVLELDGNGMEDIPPGLGGAGEAGRSISSYTRQLPSFSRRSSESDDRWWLETDETFVSRKPDRFVTLRARMGVDGNRSRDTRARAGSFASLEILDLSSNELSGSLPAGLLEFTDLTSLGLADNPDLAGPLSLRLMALEGLEDLHTTGTELCAPADPEFLDWLDGVTRQRVALCSRGGGAAVYLTQAVQSRAFPVPLVAGERALLRVFVTADEGAAAGMPPVRATFYRDGAATYQAEIPGTSDPIPARIDESSLSNSANAEIPGRVIQPGLEVVIEPDPDGTLDAGLGVARRIPAVGRMAVDVRAMPVFEVTLVPFIWQESPDSSIIGIVDAMTADPEGHELFERTHLLLPVSEIDATAHEPVATSTNNGFGLVQEVEMIRVAEGGRGHYLAVMAPPTTPGGLLGVANGIGSWSSFSVLDSETIAHEFGHNRNLYHAPCGGAGGPDRYYPYGRGAIGAWGYDFGTGTLVPPGQADFMSYCEPTWTSDYQFTNAVRYRLETETGSILIATGAATAATGRALLLWGGLDGEGAPSLRPSFFMDVPPALPEAEGPWSLTGTDTEGTVLFSLSFAMAQLTDTDDHHAGFSFAVPVTWTEELARITLQGPGGSAGLDGDSDLPMTILRDPVTSRIRGILTGAPEAAPRPFAAAAAAAAQDLQVLFSRGIPDPADARR